LRNRKFFLSTSKSLTRSVVKSVCKHFCLVRIISIAHFSSASDTCAASASASARLLQPCLLSKYTPHATRPQTTTMPGLPNRPGLSTPGWSSSPTQSCPIQRSLSTMSRISIIELRSRRPSRSTSQRAVCRLPLVLLLHSYSFVCLTTN
jgi:hypothetical protein